MAELPELAPYDYYTKCDGYVLVRNIDLFFIHLRFQKIPYNSWCMY